MNDNLEQEFRAHLRQDTQDSKELAKVLAELSTTAKNQHELMIKQDESIEKIEEKINKNEAFKYKAIGGITVLVFLLVNAEKFLLGLF